MKMKLKLAGMLLASVAIGIVVRILVKVSEATAPPEPKTVAKRREIDAAVEEAVKQGGYRAYARMSDLPN